MKKSILAMMALAVMITASTAQAQTGQRTGLIDMAHVFENYKKFEGMRDGLKSEMDQTDAEARQMVDRLKKMQEEIQKFDAGSAQYEQAEKAILDAKGKLDSFVASAKRRFGRREAEMLKIVYNDVTAAVKLYAEYAKFDHVMRFNRKGMEDADNPQVAIQTMNKTFIFWKTENDITDKVLGYLNQEYAKNPNPNPIKQTSGSGKVPVRQ